jgi:hypothetical protein
MRLTILGALIALLLCASPALATDYYVDSAGGADTNTGTSSAAPLKTIGAANAKTLTAGDTVQLKRGSAFTQELNVAATENGTSTSRILVTAYGTGTDPSFTLPTSGYTHGVSVDGDYVTVEHVKVAAAHDAGVTVDAGADNAIVRDSEITNAGLGVALRGAWGLATNVYVHDLRMIVNTPGGDDDYGAECFWVEGDNNEINYSRGVNCSAASYDYGTDGGFVEAWQHADGLYVHHNRAENTQGIFEGSGQFSNVRIDYNVFRDPHGGMCLHNFGTFGASSVFTNFRFANNTVVSDAGGYRLVDCATGLTPSMVALRNNVLSIEYPVLSSGVGSITHENNLYNLTGATAGYTLAASERSGSPAFASRSTGDYHLTSGSLAIDLAAPIAGYTSDFDGNPYSGAGPDAGAYEYASAPDTTAPAVSLTAPVNGATVSGNVPLTATASDNVGVSHVEFYDGATLIANDTGSPWAATWATTVGMNGSHTLTAKAYDAAGNTTTSTTVTVTVANPTVTSVNDNTLGTAFTGQWSYGTGWSYAAPDATSGKYQNDDHYANAANSTATFRFTGTQIKLYARTASHHGKASVSIDGGTAATIDMYSASTVNQALVFSSSTLTSGQHTLTFKALGTKQTASTGTYVVVDRADVTA